MASRPTIKRHCGQTDYSLCIKCKKKKEPLVQPKLPSFNKFLECVRKRSEYGQTDFVNISLRLGEHSTGEMLLEKRARWHRSCYQECTHAHKIKRAKANFDATLSTSCLKHTSRKRGRTLEPCPTEPVTVECSKICLRSCGEKLDKTKYFFCDTGDENGDLHQVSGKGQMSTSEKIYKVIMTGDNAKWKVKLQGIYVLMICLPLI